MKKTKLQRTKTSFLQKRIASVFEEIPKNIIAPFPKNALIELNSSCNHSCVFCTNPRMTRKNAPLSLETFKEFAEEAASLGLSEIGFYTTGEPLMNKNLEAYISIAKNAGIGYIYITTNGALASISKMKKLIDAGLNSIKFSINAGTAETYKLIHGKDDFNKVHQNLADLHQYISENKLPIKLLSSFITTRFSEHETELYIEKVSPIVDDYAIIKIGPQGGQSLEELALLSTFSDDAHPSTKKIKPCGMLWSRLHLTQEGYLSLCCIDYDNNLLYAKYAQGELASLWNSERIQAMRQRHLDRDLLGSLCHNCLHAEEKPFEPLWDVEFAQKDNSKGTLDVHKRITLLKDGFSE